MTDWQVSSLGTIADACQGAVRTGPFGSQLHQYEYAANGEVAVVMPKNIVDGRVSLDGIARISAITATRLSEHILHPGDIVLARRGDIGRAAWVDGRTGPLLCGTGSMRVSLPRGEVLARFVYYFMRTSIAIGWLQSHAVGATMPNLNANIVRALPVQFPSKDVQRSIIAALDALDDLIDNNLQRTELLGKMRDLLLPGLMSGRIEMPLLDHSLVQGADG